MKSIIIFFAVLVFICASGAYAQPPMSEDKPYEAHCEEPLPVFTLERDTNLTKEQEKSLCECIWKNLGKWEREVSERISQGREDEVSEMYLKAFSYRFGIAVKKCGGMDL